MLRVLNALILAGLCWSGALADSVAVNDVRLRANDDGTRVVFDLSAPVDHFVFTLRDPDRVVIDLTDARLSAASLPAGAGAVNRIRSGARNGALRIVLDLKQAQVRTRSLILPPNGSAGHRLVVDLVPNDQAHTPAPVVVTPARRDVLVAIDPGHGGNDPGAVGRRGTHEKRVALEIARRLELLVNAEPGMRAILTREADQFVSHLDRMKRARDQRADFFISIHADAFKDSSVRGSSVYALSTSGATSEAARWLAERENAADLIGGVKLDDKDALLASVLLDLSQTAAISASLKAGSLIIDELAKVNRIRRRDVQQAGFLVLKSPDIPSVLVETAFISNADEERRLADASYQQKLAQAMLTGIRNYFADYAPPDTLLAELRANGTTSLR